MQMKPNRTNLFHSKNELLFLDQVLHPQLVALLLLRLEQVPQGPVERLRRLNHRDGPQAFVSVFVQQVRLPVHEVVLEALRRLGLDREQILPALLNLR